MGIYSPLTDIVIYREHILSIENTFYLQRTHLAERIYSPLTDIVIYREHILSVENTFYLQRTHLAERIYSPLTDIVIVHIVSVNESSSYTPLETLFHIQNRYQPLQTHPL